MTRQVLVFGSMTRIFAARGVTELNDAVQVHDIETLRLEWHGRGSNCGVTDREGESKYPYLHPVRALQLPSGSPYTYRLLSHCDLELRPPYADGPRSLTSVAGFELQLRTDRRLTGARDSTGSTLTL